MKECIFLTSIFDYETIGKYEMQRRIALKTNDMVSLFNLNVLILL